MSHDWKTNNTIQAVANAPCVIRIGSSAPGLEKKLGQNENTVTASAATNSR
jgi:hypothetical protein